MYNKAKVIPYNKGLIITNTSQLSLGTGARYLEAMTAHNGDLVAVTWRHKIPGSIPADHILIEYGRPLS